MIIVTTDGVEGKRIKRVHGLVMGNSVRARNLGRDIIAGLRSIFGGNIPEYAELMTQSREQSIALMTKKAEDLGADGIVAVRFITAGIMGGVAELLAYGTAVELEDV